MPANDSKRAAGRRAADMVPNGATVGLGTGSTVYFTLVRLTERIREEGLRIRGLPTSLDTAAKAEELGITLAGLDDVERLPLTIDGADEIDFDFQMIKGGGGALLREKVVASITDRVVIVVGRDKLVERLGVRFLLPVEVVPFARPTVARTLRALGCEPILRLDGPGRTYATDNRNEILDCRFPRGIEDPPHLEKELAQIPGIVESGLFIDLAHVLVVGEADGSCEVREKGWRP